VKPGTTAHGELEPVAADRADRAGHSHPVDRRTPGESGLVVVIADLRPTVLRALRLLVETVVIPMVLLLTLIHTVGLLIALAATLGWLYLALAARFVSRRRLPGTLFVCVSMMSGRALVAILTSSAFIYMLQPVLGSTCMALLFVGSAVAGRPLTMRLARDFVSIPAHILARQGVRRMFTQIALLWGISRVADAAMNLGLLHMGLDAGLLSRGILSPILTVLTVGISIAWGMRALRLDGIHLQLGGGATV
jgi:hypothetical protein